MGKTYEKIVLKKKKKKIIEDRSPWESIASNKELGGELKGRKNDPIEFTADCFPFYSSFEFDVLNFKINLFLYPTRTVCTFHSLESIRCIRSEKIWYTGWKWFPIKLIVILTTLTFTYYFEFSNRKYIMIIIIILYYIQMIYSNIRGKFLQHFWFTENLLTVQLNVLLIRKVNVMNLTFHTPDRSSM